MMHATLIPGLLGCLDKEPNAAGNFSGWLLTDRQVTTTDCDEFKVGLARPDVAAVYGPAAATCGFSGRVRNAKAAIILVDGREALKVESMHWTLRASPAMETERPLLYVEDNFYADPDGVRAFALQQEFVRMNTNKGLRTAPLFTPPWLADKLKRIFNCRDIQYEGANGVFQYCTAEEPLVYHVDSQQYAGIVFLSPDAPPETGTSFYRDKTNKLMYLDSEAASKTGKDRGQLIDEMFAGGFYDSTRFDLVDTVGNVYNRLVIFNGHLIHAASKYYGTRKEDSRMFQLFFFNIS